MSEKKIMPCIFCGVQNSMFVSEREDKNYQIWCSKCECLGPKAPSPEEAIDLWNAASRKHFDAILPCPFCNSDDNVMIIDITAAGDGEDTFKVECLKCGMSGPIMKDPGSTISAWNQISRCECEDE